MVDVFLHVPDDELKAVVQYGENIFIPAGEIFIEQGAKAEFLDIVLQGGIKIFVTLADGEQLELGTVEPGETVGEMGYFSDGVRTASARASGSTVLLRLHYADFGELFKRIPHLSHSFLMLLTRRLRSANLNYQQSLFQSRSAEKSLHRLNNFLDLSDELVMGRGIEGLIDRVVSLACISIYSERATLFLVDPGTGELWSKVTAGEDTQSIRLPAGTGIAGWAVKHKEIVNISDVYADDRFNQSIDAETGFRTRNMLCGPITNLQGQTVGVIQIINKFEGDFDDKDIVLFKAFANQAAIAVEHANLYLRLMASHQKMAVLLDVANSVSTTLDLPRLIHKVIEKTVDILDCDRASFFVYDRNAGELWSVEARGEEIQEIRFPSVTGLAGYCATNDSVVNVRDAYQDPRLNQEIDKKTGYRTTTVLCVPVRDRDGKVIGVSQAINKTEGNFSVDDVDMLNAFASQIGVALINAQLHNETLETKNFLERVHESMTDSMLTLNNNFEVVTANRSAHALFSSLEDSKESKLPGKTIERVIGQHDHPIVKLAQKVHAEQASAIELDVLLDRKTRSHSLDVNAMPLTDHNGEFKGSVILLEDRTSEKSMKQHLSRYLSKDVVERMIEDPAMRELGGKDAKATILFADIRSFTSIAEDLTAAETMNFLNEFFSVVVEVLEKHGGFVDKIIGDAVMAVFGVPFLKDDDAVRAVQAGLRVQEAVKELNFRRRESGQAAIKIGVGLNTDTVISGNLGSATKMDFTVIGDGVNISARLEGLTKDYGIPMLVTESTRAEIGDAFETLLIDDVLFKGKSNPVKVYEVIGEKGAKLNPDQQCFKEGLEAYRQQDFKTALRQFHYGPEHSRIFSLFINRCELYQRKPPGEDWDGVWDGRSKRAAPRFANPE